MVPLPQSESSPREHNKEPIIDMIADAKLRANQFRYPQTGPQVGGKPGRLGP